LKIGIISCCKSNVSSVANALSHVGLNPVLLSKPEEACDFLIMPGVGSFDSGIHHLKLSGFYQYIVEHINTGKPFIGICLGMQILFNTSEEGTECGLSVLSGHLEELSDGTEKNSRIAPNIGYNFVDFSGNKDGHLIGEELNGFYYFLHSYALKQKPGENLEIGTSKFNNQNYYSFFVRENICGIQFHPERSGNRGLLLISRVIESMQK